VIVSQGAVYPRGAAIGILIPIQFYELLHRDSGALRQNLHRHNGLIGHKFEEMAPDELFHPLIPSSEALSLISTALAWAVSPSALAMVAAAGPKVFTASSLKAITLLNLRKSTTLKAEEKRALPPVGMTWLGPAT
jgi:hypothetical protein